MTGEVLPPAFYERSAAAVAPDLIGCVLVRRLRWNGRMATLAGRIVETEAYCADDPASHSYRGRTRRNAPMFGPPGHAYVYRSYGVHWCLNAVTAADGVGEAVLLRALQPLDGLEIMRTLRDVDDTRLLCSGPGRLCQAFAVAGDLNGVLLSGEMLGVLGPPSPRPQVVSCPRIGISKARDASLRFCEADSEYLSRPCRTDEGAQRG